MALTSIAFEHHKATISDNIAVITDAVMHETAGSNESKVMLALATMTDAPYKVMAANLVRFEPPLFYEVTSTKPTMEVNVVNVWTMNVVKKRNRLRYIANFVFRRIR